ncbi:FkbH-like protein [Saccharothrix tamanrassetensis]|uniref:FkbH-like protein n=1 Tax=Saccharothrix tamanrassetensis TaxID=1051531 RepID=A0A841C964_9PSEU|nr:HAD-IIIC family phosphatase [Saccharothrix tamanrassetensis]MBB5953681.1 FkbH-like protein [Saccharothrix tamanrassetensis]
MTDLVSHVRTLVAEGRFDDAWASLRPALRLDGDYRWFNRAARLLATAARHGWTPAYRREARLAVLSTYETAELGELLAVACAVHGLRLDVHLPPFGQVEQQLLGSADELVAFAPTHVLLAPSTHDLSLPELVDRPEAVVDEVVARWTGAWRRVLESGARPVQHLFVVPDSAVLGNLALGTPRSRSNVVREINRRLADAATRRHVLVVDVDRIAADIGKSTWSDHRIWYATRQPASYDGLAATARGTGAVLAADAGLGCKCLVLDLDGSVWGGVVGDVGWDGVEVGPGVRGEAFRAFQDFLAGVREAGVLLAVSSKNDEATAREPFERNPHMRLRLEDFSAFVADWRPKSEQVRDIVEALGISPEDVVLLDDNPAECLEVGQRLPGVGTVPLTGPVADFPRLVASSVLLEPVYRTDEDATRAASYAARDRAEVLRAEAASLPEFWRSLEMTARVRPVSERTVQRAAQLSRRTNQFNLTLRRRSPAEIDALGRDPDWICLTLALADRFADHGIVGLCLAGPAADGELPVDTLVLSCRVIGRTAEHHLLAALSRHAAERGIRRLRGHYVPGPRNALVADLYDRLGFRRDGDDWCLDLTGAPPIDSPHIREQP